MADINNLITNNIDVWTSAIRKRNATGRGSNKKIELTGIKKLRELILELAVRGKLVPQNINDEPASVLLEKIAEEKAQLIANKKIKQQKSLPAMANEEKGILPIGWSNAYMQDITKVVTCGMASTPKYHDQGRIFLSAKNVKPYKFMPADHKFVDEETYRKITQNAKPEKDDILLTRVGAGIGEAAVIDIDIEFAIYVSLTLIKPFHNHLYSYFILLWLNSPQGTKKSIDNIYGRGVSAGNLNVNLVRGFVLPIPPLAEQHLIVAKVDELMALCDQLEQQTEESLTAHQTLVEVLLAALTDSADAEDFQTSWQRIAEHFDVLFTTELSIEKLKQTILQLAVMGKLVPQNPSDEPASVLLEKIAEEKAQLIADKKIKKQKPLTAITDEEKPFELPKGWEWIKLGEVSLLKGGFAYKSTAFVDKSEHQVVRMGNIRPDKFRLNEKTVFIKADLASSTQEYEIVSGDILLTMTGTKGKRDYLYSLMVRDVDLSERQLYLNQRLCISRPLLVDSKFVNLLLKENRLLDLVYEKSTGTANQANIGMEAIQNWTLPLPPVEEQRQISKKVDELMVLCEQLKARLTDAQITQLHLADAVVENALGDSL
jgi:type I restriction enzyme S subunit